ncbi:hypothetical protein G3I59_14235 [Amycolatopsis rubida]|uniref:Uncharacterized protein n=1 Tax=Amycolatopsis rubida TaxID=112413 RepID=A0ABX0BNY6_9PSEU|nr:MULTISPECIES: hypothetical protein [Amycolatopsis]MYW91725.1 hypothetical protein [Amycolatopsis rubida]NEC56709.1 hypothetical protein [Amycolatopsis rubida]OAP20394.1 hypothetical protein A4R44_08818 [Amycolatopsis sp. M39]
MRHTDSRPARPGAGLPGTVAAATAAFGHPIALPAATEPGTEIRVQIRSGDHGPEAITCTLPASRLTVITERGDLRPLDLAEAAAEALFATWHFDPAHDGSQEQWLRGRQRDAHHYATTAARSLPVDGQDRPGVCREHDGHAAWSGTLDALRISIAGPADILTAISLRLHTQ